MNLLSVSQRKKNNTLFIVKACWEHCRWFISYCGTYRYLLSCHGKHISFILQYSSVDKTGTVRVFFRLDWKRSLLVFETLQFPVQGSLMQIKTQSGSGWPQRDRSSLHRFQTNGFCTLSLILKTRTITYPAHNLLFLSSEMCA